MRYSDYIWADDQPKISLKQKLSDSVEALQRLASRVASRIQPARPETPVSNGVWARDTHDTVFYETLDAGPAPIESTGLNVDRFIYRAEELWIATPYLKNAWIGLYLLGAIVLPYGFLLWHPVVGAFATVMSVAALMGLAVASEKARKLAISTAIIPLALMVVMTLPRVSLFTELAVFYATLLVLSGVYRFMFTLGPDKAGASTSRWSFLPLLPAAVVVGQVLGLLGAIVLRHQYLFSGQSISAPLLIGSVVVFALIEEWLFRGLIQNLATEVLHPGVAAAVVAIMYALASMGLGSFIGFVMALLMGAVLCGIYAKRPNLILTMTANAVSKIVFVGVFLIFGLR